MTCERSVYVRLPPHVEEAMRGLFKGVNAARRRMLKLPAGERSEAVRFETLHAAIERLAVEAVWAGEATLESEAMTGGGAPSVLYPGVESHTKIPREVMGWLGEGRWAVQLMLPHRQGPTLLAGEEGRGPPPPIPRWQSSKQSVDRRASAAMTQRFKDQMERAVANPGAPDAVIRPSRIANMVLTETLRSFSVRVPGVQALEAPVVYQDGSRGQNFPLRNLPLVDEKPPRWKELRFTLLSIRHVDMDSIVDGAWLRNALVSKPRPAGATDDFVFDTSRRQLRALVQLGPVILSMYQTGLEPAVVGFYRAVARHLVEYPGTLAVVPRYFRGQSNFDEGMPWTTR